MKILVHYKWNSIKKKNLIGINGIKKLENMQQKEIIGTILEYNKNKLISKCNKTYKDKTKNLKKSNPNILLKVTLTKTLKHQNNKKNNKHKQNNNNIGCQKWKQKNLTKSSKQKKKNETWRSSLINKTMLQ